MVRSRNNIEEDEETTLLLETSLKTDQKSKVKEKSQHRAFQPIKEIPLIFEPQKRE